MKANRRQAALLSGAVLVSGLLCGVAIAANPHGTPPGQANQQTTTTATTSDNSTGVKPSSTTAHGAHNTHAAAGSNKTKQYGNGKTAGQIAEKNGASSDTDLYGPGNSQPHKVLVCSNGKSHWVDVHALKSHRAGACPTGGSSGSSSSSSLNAAGTNGSANAAGTSTSSDNPSSSSGVLGASHTSGAKPVAAHAKPAHAVLGTASFTG
jgi:hypothetical protein